ncbi:MAG: NAD(P)/FAD-dependent oxidoreductase [Spirochaetes bacterium]|nr:NAD(P)/FAD-dependent oxidoreductase [Spirochaetota bacterium]
MKEYDLAIIGSGPAGYTAAFEAAKHRLKTAIIERDLSRLGGVCLGEGCIPLKGLLYHSRANKDYLPLRDMVIKRVEQIRAGLKSRIDSVGIDLIQGEGRFVSRDRLDVAGVTIRAQKYLIATGSSPKRYFNQPNVFPSEKIFSLDKTPGSVLIIGGGVVGCEYASFLSSIGVRVTIVEMLGSLLAGEDEESVRVLAREFRKNNVAVHVNSRVTGITQTNEATYSNGQGEIKKTFDLIFETTGRNPNTAGLGLDAAGVMLDENGFISVDKVMQTSASGIYAAGDCINTPMLAYTAYKEAAAAVRHMAEGKTTAIDYQSMPRLVFSDPQVGSVGASASTAKERNITPRIYKYFFKALGKAVMEGHDAGFVKIVADADSDRIVGASAVGNDITDIINHLATIIWCGITVSQIKDCMFVHPSYSEILLEAIHYGKQ